MDILIKSKTGLENVCELLRPETKISSNFLFWDAFAREDKLFPDPDSISIIYLVVFIPGDSYVLL